MSSSGSRSGSALSDISIRQSLSGAVPFLVILGVWFLVVNFYEVSSYKLPPIEKVVTRTINMIADGSLLEHS